MPKKSVVIYIAVSAILFLCAAVNFADIPNKIQQQNQPPVLKIINPKNNSTFDAGTQITYEISVDDKEDGNSKYDEINTKEILLEVKHIKDKSKIPVLLSSKIQDDPPGLAVIRSSNCFNCHSFNDKAIGPSFFEISKRYPATIKNIDSLAKHIREGSTGIWGKEKMPTHPELNAEQTKSTVQWILKHAADPDINYYFGIAGSIRIKSPVVSKAGDSYILTASYIDHGIKNSTAKHLKGQDMVVIGIK